MVSEVSSPLNDDVNKVKEKPVNRSLATKKNTGKTPRKVHKAEREKLKRDSLNVLFLELSKTLEPSQQNNGKASIVTDTTRLLRELLTQVNQLRKENTALLSESHYVTAEKDELREDNFSLEAQIEKLQSEIEKRVHSNYSWNLDHSLTQNNKATSQHLEDHLVMPVGDCTSHQANVLGPVYVVPLHHDLQAYHEPDNGETVSKLPKTLSKPLPRYPSPSDSWPSQILSKQPETTPIAQYTCSGTSSSTNSRD